jgi:DNA-binding response OmpR family regulator
VWLTYSQDDVVSKPFRIPELVPKIEELGAKFPNSPELSPPVEVRSVLLHPPPLS